MCASQIIAVDCGVSHVACGLFARGAGNRLVLRRFACEPINPDPGLDGTWSKSVGGVLKLMAGREKFRGDCRLALPGHRTLTKFVRTPALAPAKRALSIRFEAQQSMPCPLEEVAWDHLLVADDGLDLEMMLVAAKTRDVEALHAVAAAAGLAVRQIAPSGASLLDAFRYNHPEVSRPAAVLNIGARTTELVFVEGEHFFMRTLALGGNAVTDALAHELQIDFAQAEALKIRAGAQPGAPIADSAARRVVESASANFIGRLQLEFVRTAAAYRHRGGAIRPAAVFLSGGGSLLPALPGRLAEKLGLPVERCEPLRKVELAAPARASGAESWAPTMAGLVGLATGLVNPEQPALNLLPTGRAEALVLRRRQPWLLATAILTIAALLPVVWHYDRMAAANSKNTAAVESQLKPLRRLAALNAARSARIVDTENRIAALQRLAGAKTGWLRLLADLQERLGPVEDVWLEKLEPQPVPGAGSRPSAAAMPSPALSPLRGAPAWHLALSGRLLDKDNPVSKVSPAAYLRVRHLFQAFSQSPFVAGVADERFDSTQPGLLRFACTLVINPAAAP